ncbi:MAG: ATPase [Acidimicrobiia bacterium]
MEQYPKTVEETASALEAQGYLPDRHIASTVFLALRLEKPLLVEGPAGTGKTELSKALSGALGRRLIRLQCYEGLDESKALYEWNYRKQLLRIQAEQSSDSRWESISESIFTEEFLLERPLLQAIRSPEPVVFLVDEVDRLEIETEALFLEVFSDFQVSIPELGTVKAVSRPVVVLTSNATRELSEALKRRCLFLYLDYPSVEREKQILLRRVPAIGELLAEQVARIVRSIRELDLKKPPSVSESIDWARTLVELGVTDIESSLAETLNVLLKNKSDLDRVVRELGLDQPEGKKKYPFKAAGAAP